MGREIIKGSGAELGGRWLVNWLLTYAQGFVMTIQSKEALVIVFTKTFMTTCIACVLNGVIYVLNGFSCVSISILSSSSHFENMLK